MNSSHFDLYTDYLIASFGQTTATGLSHLLDGAISHDQVSRMLSSKKKSAQDLWRKVKPLVHKVQSPKGVLIIDDTIEEKPYTDENEIVCWHYDHSKGRTVKGINLITVLYQNTVEKMGLPVSIPVSFDLVEKTHVYKDEFSGKVRRRSVQTKNERFQLMLSACVKNQIEFGYVLADVWFASSDNMRFVKLDLGKDFIFPLKSNRKVALSLKDKQAGRYVAVEQLEIEPGTIREVYLSEVSFPVYMNKHLFKNEDGSIGVQYLVSSDGTLDSNSLQTCYQRRWKVEEYHKSLKQNASLAKSPTRTETTQTNHLYASICAFVKLEQLRMKTSKNHFALKTSLYVKALKAAFEQLQSIKGDNLKLNPTA